MSSNEREYHLLISNLYENLSHQNEIRKSILDIWKKDVHQQKRAVAFQKSRNFNHHSEEDDDTDESTYEMNLSVNYLRGHRIANSNMYHRWIVGREILNRCESDSISVGIPPTYGWITRKETRLYARAVVKCLSEEKYQPFSLKHLAAAASIEKLHSVPLEGLIGIYNTFKNQIIQIRSGVEYGRKIYNFNAVVKNYIYKILNCQLVADMYFEKVSIQPKAFCIKCGLFQRIDSSVCDCHFSYFLHHVIMSTAAIENYNAHNVNCNFKN